MEKHRKKASMRLCGESERDFLDDLESYRFWG